jgi:copine 5/8/9
VRKISRRNASDATSEKMIIPLGELCNSDKYRNIRFRVVDAMNHACVYDEVVTSVNEMESKKSFEAATGATLVLLSSVLFDKATFVDYLRSGVQISLVAAVDYTASNGDPSSP